MDNLFHMLCVWWSAVSSQWIWSKFLVVDLNHLKEKIIKQWETLLGIQSSEDVLTAPCMRADASFKISLSFPVGKGSHVLSSSDSLIEIYNKLKYQTLLNLTSNIAKLKFLCINNKETKSAVIWTKLINSVINWTITVNQRQCHVIIVW
jgi:hypothetical protein